jgi:ABC-2 type transport system ATP-binding protein
MKQIVVDTAILDKPQQLPEDIRGLLRYKRDSQLETDSVIVVQRLKKTYGENTVVNDVSFEVEQGEIFGLLGPNGAGKSTTTEIIEGLRTADSGTISVLGMDGVKNTNEIKQKIGIQLQIPSLLPLLNVEEIIDLFGGVYRHSLPTGQLLKLLSLEESRKVLTKNLSGGQQQRLSVAMALVNDPEIAFLDEPSTGLDPQARRNLWSVIEEMRARGKTIFLTTHFMEEAERLCDRIAIMDHGKIIASDAPQELINTYFKESAIQFEADIIPSLDTMKSFQGATEVAIDNGEVVIYSKDVQATMSAVLQYAESNDSTRQLKNLHVRQSTLEDVFLKLTGRRIRN